MEHLRLLVVLSLLHAITCSFMNVDLLGGCKIPRHININNENKSGELIIKPLLTEPLPNVIEAEIPKKDGVDERTAIIQEFFRSPKSKWYLPETQNKSTCRLQIRKLHTAIFTAQNWALHMVDSWGKFSDGILEGNNELPGFYDECLLSVSDDQQIHGRYCSIYYTSKGNEDISSNKELRARLGVLSGRNVSQLVLPYSSYGTCVPDGCSQEDVIIGLQHVMASHSRRLVKVHCDSSVDTIKISFGTVAFILYFGVVVILMLSAMVMKRLHYPPYSGWKRIVMAFSLEDNVNKIFTIDQTEDGGNLKCIHGLRVITMVCIHMCHEIGMTIHSSNMASSYVGKRDSVVAAVVISSASLGVDTFLFISGLLVAYSAFKQFQFCDKVSVLRLYCHRFIRLSPPIIVTAWFFATIGRHLLAGPWYSEYELIENACSKYWWKDAFFIFNFFPTSSSDNAFASCLGQCWYTAVDFQLFLIAPFLIYIVLKYPSYGRVFLSTLTLACFIIPSVYIYHTGLPPTNILKLDERRNYEYFTRIYSMPWHRAAPWMVGFLTGYMMLKSGPDKLGKKTVAAGWIASTSIGAIVIVRMTYLNLNPKYYDSMDDYSSALYGGTHRGLWAIALAWIVFSSQNGSPGFCDLLSYSGFQPLSRLAYPVYLVSLNIQFALSWAAKRPAYVSILSKVIDASGSFMICVVVGFILSLMTESPILHLMKCSPKTASRKKYS